MNDIVAEKLVQKVTNLMDEVTDVNLLVRRIPPPQETINKISDRIDAIHVSVGEIAKGIEADQARIDVLEAPAETLLEGRKKADTAIENALENFRRTGRASES
ncbi:MAG TPA: hypothetical protein VKU83_05160 [Puia sp.]|nr:hypothetical protein [Puia sp.]